MRMLLARRRGGKKEGEGSALGHGETAGGGGVKERGGDSRTSWRFCAQSYSETFEHLFHESAYYVRRRGGCRANRPPTYHLPYPPTGGESRLVSSP